MNRVDRVLAEEQARRPGVKFSKTGAPAEPNRYIKTVRHANGTVCDAIPSFSECGQLRGAGAMLGFCPRHKDELGQPQEVVFEVGEVMVSQDTAWIGPSADLSAARGSDGS